MNISKINSSLLNFGSIKKSAARRAIQMACGNISELGIIKDAIEKQKDNKSCDIECSPAWMPGNYIVIKQGEKSNICFQTLLEACACADMCKDSTISRARTKQEKEEFDRLAKELLASCEE